MYEYFYNFHNQPLANNLFTRDTEDGTPAPPSSQVRDTNDGQTRITDDGQTRLTD